MSSTIFSGKFPANANSAWPTENVHLNSFHLEGTVEVSALVNGNHLWGLDWLRKGTLEVAHNPQKLYVEMKSMFLLQATCRVEIASEDEFVKIVLDAEKQIFHVTVQINSDNFVEKLFFLANVYSPLMASLRENSEYLLLVDTGKSGGINFGQKKTFSWYVDPKEGALAYLAERAMRPMFWVLDNLPKDRGAVSPARGMSKLPLIVPVGTKMSCTLNLEPAKTETSYLQWTFDAQPR